MEFFITFAIVIFLFAAWFYYFQKKRKKINDSINESLEDETIFVQGRGRIKFEDLDAMVNGDPNEGVKEVKDTMFREDLMRFEGEFLVPGLALNEERRLSIDDAFLYLLELFGEELFHGKRMVTPDDPMVPFTIKAVSEIIPLANTIAKMMDIDPACLAISFYKGQKEFDPGTMDRYEEKSAAGWYRGKNKQGRYEVSFSDTLHKQPESLIATIAHEFAHIKLLGEGRMTENSEELTDMVPLIYGFGIFNSNSVFKFSRDNVSWSTSKLGYLTQVDWAYLMALYMYVRDELDSNWLRHLNKTIAKDCRIALDFILKNPDKVFQPPQDS